MFCWQGLRHHKEKEECDYNYKDLPTVEDKTAVNEWLLARSKSSKGDHVGKAFDFAQKVSWCCLCSVYVLCLCCACATTVCCANDSVLCFVQMLTCPVQDDLLVCLLGNHWRGKTILHNTTITNRAESKFQCDFERDFIKTGVFSRSLPCSLPAPLPPSPSHPLPHLSLSPCRGLGVLAGKPGSLGFSGRQGERELGPVVGLHLHLCKYVCAVCCLCAVCVLLHLRMCKRECVCVCK